MLKADEMKPSDASDWSLQRVEISFSVWWHKDLQKPLVLQGAIVDLARSLANFWKPFFENSLEHLWLVLNHACSSYCTHKWGCALHFLHLFYSFSPPCNVWQLCSFALNCSVSWPAFWHFFYYFHWSRTFVCSLTDAFICGHHIAWCWGELALLVYVFHIEIISCTCRVWLCWFSFVCFVCFYYSPNMQVWG